MSLAKDELLVGNEQTYGHDVFLVLEGRVTVFQHGSSNADIFLGEIGPEGLVGEFAVISGRPGWASARTAVPSVLLKIPREAFLAILSEHPNVALKLLKNLVGLIHNLDARIVARSEVDQAVDATVRRLFLSTL